MGILEILLFPLYVYLFYFFIKRRARGFSDPLLMKYYLKGFLIRVGSCFAFTVFLVYISPGDSLLYFWQATDLYHQTFSDISVFGKVFSTPADQFDSSLLSEELGGLTVFGTENNFMPIRVAYLFMFLTGGKYLLTNLLFSLLAYEGCWRLYRFFYEQFPKLHKEFAIGILYFPTFIFWSSGISKEAICIGGLGFITYGMYSIFIKHRQMLLSAATIFLFSFLMIKIKIYIFLSYMPFIIFFLVLQNVKRVKMPLLRWLIGPITILVSFIGVIIIILSNSEILGVYSVPDLGKSMQTQQMNFDLQENSESNYSLGTTYDGTLFGLVKVAPYAIAATLFRPFLWETRKFSTALSSLESLAMILFTLFVLARAGPMNFIRILFKTPLVSYSFFYAVTFCIFIGATTTNFGSLVRYKVPCLPFYLISLFLILHLSGKYKTATT